MVCSLSGGENDDRSAWDSWFVNFLEVVKPCRSGSRWSGIFLCLLECSGSSPFHRLGLLLVLHYLHGQST